MITQETVTYRAEGSLTAEWNTNAGECQKSRNVRRLAMAKGKSSCDCLLWFPAKKLNKSYTFAEATVTQDTFTDQRG